MSDPWTHVCRRCCHLVTEHRMGRLSNSTYWCQACSCPIGSDSPMVPMSRRQFAIYDGLAPDKRAAFAATVIRLHDEARAS